MPVDELTNKRLLMVTGKGGIGKTLASVALGIAAAQRGKRTLILQHAAHDQVAALFGQPHLDAHHFHSLAPNLDTLNIDSKLNFKDYVTKELGLAKLFDRVLSHPALQTLVTALPGIRELLMLGRLFYESQRRDPAYDLVVFDGYASGHFFHLLSTPGSILQAGLSGRVVEETEKVLAFLRDQNMTELIPVTSLEAMSIAEAIEFTEKFKGLRSAHLHSLIINRVPWSLLGPSESSKVTRETSVTRYLEATKNRAEAQLAVLRASSLGQLSPLIMPDWGAIEEPIDPFNLVWDAGRPFTTWEGT